MRRETIAKTLTVGALTGVIGVALGKWLHRKDRIDRISNGAAVREGEGPVRPAGPDGMRTPPRREWTAVDEASDESFPASDPAARY